MGFVKMCFGGGKNKTEEDAKSAAIDRQLATDRRKMLKTKKMLLLGAGESGKTTIHKQMLLLYKNGFTPDLRAEYKAVVFNNLIQSFQSVLAEMSESDTDFSDASNNDLVDTIKQAESLEMGEDFPEEFLAIFQKLIKDDGVQSTVARGNEFALLDNLPYFIANLDRIFAPTFVPTDEDILRARLRTTGIHETVFELGGDSYRMFDVGGQRSERKKWLQCFDGVDAMLFLASVSGYDQSLIEDRNANQMREALQLFENLANSQYFQDSAIILFLNKTDLFEEKIKSGRSPIAKNWPDYDGHPMDSRAGLKYFERLFRSRVKNPGKTLYVKCTNATDTKLLSHIMVSMQDHITQTSIKAAIGEL